MFRRLKLLALILILLPLVSFSEGTNVAVASSYLGLVPPVRVTFAGGSTTRNDNGTANTKTDRNPPGDHRAS
jgi:hypothetical protein